jgi:hypothetical protein
MFIRLAYQVVQRHFQDIGHIRGYFDTELHLVVLIAANHRPIGLLDFGQFILVFFAFPDFFKVQVKVVVFLIESESTLNSIVQIGVDI